ncbi:hypothetical protein T02_6504 [Trichinella nativa]|uniref:Uncharacterized protein n=1 Tax=Trichinella nativa TaxID=6335 RepID=A0A0V1LHU1_9BILA|nr:hypothetical protein T02_6504 [Trichinella nativa]
MCAPGLKFSRQFRKAYQKRLAAEPTYCAFLSAQVALSSNSMRDAKGSKKYIDKIMLSRDKTENNFGVAFFCSEHIHFCSFFGKLHIVLEHMIGGSARTKSGVLLVSVTVALGGFLRMASRAINGW